MTLLAAVLFLLLQTPAQQQTPPQAQPPKASIEGFVLRAGTNEPVSRARVTVVRGVLPGGAPVQLTTASTIPPVTTDNQGHFLVKDLDAGNYTLTAQRNGFARQVYGERAPNRPGTPLSIVAGQAVKDIVFRLTPAGAVSGRVSDLTGEALPRINVQLLRSVYDVQGRRTFQSAGSAATNDRGEYRIYWVTPGRYYVNAGPNRSPIDTLPLSPTTNEVIEPGYVLTYYPGTTDAATAAPIEVQAGAELNTIDFALAQQQLFKIRGRVLDAKTGQAPRSAQIILMSRNPTVATNTFFSLGINSYNNATGTFELRDVAPGAYWVRADGALVAPPNPDPASRLSGQIAVDVSNADVENLVIAFSQGISIPGRLSIAGGAAISSLPNSDMLRVFLTARDPGVLNSINPQVVGSDGLFKIDNVQPGDYRLNVTPMPAGMYLKEARLGQTDLLGGISITGPVSGGIEVLISPNGGQLDGTIIDKDRKPVRGVQAVLIPDRQRDRRDLYRTATSDQNGQFTMRTIPPGDYKLFAWEDIEPFAYSDADLLRKYEELGTSVKIAESSKLTFEVKIIPAGQ